MAAWLTLTLRRRRRKAAVTRSSNAPKPRETRYLDCGGLDARRTCALPLTRLQDGPLNPQNVPRVCLLAVHGTWTMPVSRARLMVPDCRCSGEAAHVKSDDTLRGTHTCDLAVRCGPRHGPNRHCRAFAIAMFQCVHTKHKLVATALALILMKHPL